ncbi:hypothetical protein [Roseivivax jejudonensis]|nr:hypothetical protein [Roseivivax jejudonensis]
MRHDAPPPRPTPAAALLVALVLSMPFALLALADLLWWLVAGGRV